MTDFFSGLTELIIFFQAHPLFALGAMLVLGYALAHAAEHIGLPDISGFIIAGMLLGPQMIGLITRQGQIDLIIVTEVALGLICFTIGAELFWPKLKRVGRKVGWITALQYGFCFVGVGIALVLLQMPPIMALLLAAIAGTTSPAATVAIVQSLRARGSYVDYLYGTVALGDVLAIVIFSIIIAFAPAALGLTAGLSAGALVVSTFSRLGITLVCGFVFGFLIHVVVPKVEKPGETLIITLGFLLLGIASMEVFGLSPLLFSIAAGASLINITQKNLRVFRTLEPLTPPVYALFFVLAGTKLKLSLLTDPVLLVLGLAYVLFRLGGKYTGARLGAKISGVPRPIRRFLGISLFPQAGVALGLVLVMQGLVLDADPFVSQLIDTGVGIVLFGVLVNEIAGPPLSKIAIQRGNIAEE
ncbi:cation:proton antiporter [Spirochaeta dissipatitropha]